MIDTAFARYNIYDIGVSPLSHIFYIEPNAKAYGMFTCAPSGAEGATHRERRGQITRGATAIYCAHRALWRWEVHMCPLGGGGGDP